MQTSQFTEYRTLLSTLSMKLLPPTAVNLLTTLVGHSMPAASVRILTLIAVTPIGAFLYIDRNVKVSIILYYIYG